MNKSMLNPKIYYVVVTNIETEQQRIYEYENEKQAMEHYANEKFVELFEYDCALQKTSFVPLPIEFD